MKKFFTLALIGALSVSLSVFAYQSPGKPSGFVNDFAHILSNDQIATLENRLIGIEASTTVEISVVTIPSLGGETIESYANELFQEWGIGKKGKDNGLLLLIAPNEREMRIEVGYGLEPTITDGRASAIIRNTLVPAFRSENYYIGVDQSIREIEALLLGDTSIDQFVTNTASSEGQFDFFSSLIYFGLVFLTWLPSILARSKSWWAGGVMGGIIGIVIGFIFGFLYIGVGAIILFTLLGLFFDFAVSKSYQKHNQLGTAIPWWAGGKSGGIGRSGFGGFGGGRSGGGGASGRW